MTRPFAFEGRRRANQAEEGIAALRDEVDTLIVIPNDRLLSITDRNVSILDAFKQADQVLLQGVSGITDLITTPGLINLDFADVKSVMSNAGSALMGIGRANGDDRAVVAAEMAVSSPLLEASIDGAHGVLLSISGGSDLGLFEINEAAALVSQAAHAEANIIFGAVIDDALGDEVRVTVIAAGFDGGMPKRRDQSPAGTAARRGPDACSGCRGRHVAGRAAFGSHGRARLRSRRPRRPHRRPSPRPDQRRAPSRSMMTTTISTSPTSSSNSARPTAARRLRPSRCSQPGSASPARRASSTLPSPIETEACLLPPFDSLNLGGPDGADNRRLVASALGVVDLVVMRQVHGADVQVVDGVADEPPTCDALVSTTPAVALCVRAADCVPVVLADPTRQLSASPTPAVAASRRGSSPPPWRRCADSAPIR